MTPPTGRPGFEIVVEIEPATRPDLARVRRQVDTWSGLADRFLVPDNHLGRATVSSIAVAHEVARAGVPTIACLNSRDRNRLGFRRDLLTAAAYGVRDLLCVFGDEPSSGGRTSDLTVRTMLEEARGFGASPTFAGHGPVRVGVTTRLTPLPGWKRDADFLFVQACFEPGRLLEWRRSLDFDGPVFAAVLVVSSAAMAKTLAEATAEITVPLPLLDALESDPSAGVGAACSLLGEIRASGAFDGAHLVAVARAQELADRLRRDGWGARSR
jgi:methylenetetrahydrofolate reductase (NADPH)